MTWIRRLLGAAIGSLRHIIEPGQIWVDPIIVIYSGPFNNQVTVANLYLT